MPNTQLNILLPQEALLAINSLEKAGHEAWLVGGAVRDALLHIKCLDSDIATSARPEEITRIFTNLGFKTYETGIEHGCITVDFDPQSVEITTYRSDGRYIDLRHPESVRFVSSIEDDLARRDFTINAIAYHPQRGLCDPFHGEEDIKHGIIRAVGDPQTRISEDSLRILRACRFMSKLGFQIEPHTFQALLDSKMLLLALPSERILKELDGLMRGSFVSQTLLITFDIIEIVLPELSPMRGFPQHTPYHSFDVLEHTAVVLEHTPPTRVERWAALFHDAGKPRTHYRDDEGIDHFHGHQLESVILAGSALRRLKMPTKDRQTVCELVTYHDHTLTATSTSVKRMMKKLGGDVELFTQLCHLQIADALGHAPDYQMKAVHCQRILDILDELVAKKEPFKTTDLAINGHDLLETGIPEGPEIGATLNKLLDAIIDGRAINTRESLLAFLSNDDHQALER